MSMLFEALTNVFGNREVFWQTFLSVGREPIYFSSISIVKFLIIFFFKLAYIFVGIFEWN